MRGIKGCYFCGLVPEEMAVTFGSIVCTVVIGLNVFPVAILKGRFAKEAKQLKRGISQPTVFTDSRQNLAASPPHHYQELAPFQQPGNKEQELEIQKHYQSLLEHQQQMQLQQIQQQQQLYQHQLQQQLYQQQMLFQTYPQLTQEQYQQMLLQQQEQQQLQMMQQQQQQLQMMQQQQQQQQPYVQSVASYQIT